MTEYSFDIICKIDQQELSNALDTAKKELSHRFDFKGSHLKIELGKDAILIETVDEMKLRQLIDVIQTKMIRRGLNLKAFSFSDVETNVSGIVKCRSSIQNGLTRDQTKEITKLIKESKLKVQTRIQQNSVRVNGKSKNDLQSVQKMIDNANFDFAATFENYR